ncbi:MAG: DNA translocase FtsK 4TM domain-containing protein [Bacillota bacterium]
MKSREPRKSWWQQVPEGVRQELTGILLILLCVIAVLGMVSKNGGVAGAIIKTTLRRGLGDASWLLIAATAAWAFLLVIQRSKPHFGLSHLGFLLVLLSFAALAHHDIDASSWYTAGVSGLGGGLAGGILHVVLVRTFGTAGRYAVLFASSLVGLMIITRRSLVDSVKSLLWRQRKVKARATEAPRQPAEPVVREVNSAPIAALASVPERERPRATEPRKPDKTGWEPPAEQVTLGDSILYQLPPFSLLDKAAKPGKLRGDRDLAEKAQILQDTLESFGVRVTVGNMSRGPSVTRFELHPGPGVKVSQIVRLADDIALSLAAPQVRVEAPIPGKSAVGIEVPNSETSLVHLRDVLETPEFCESASLLTLALGKDITGKPIVASLEKMVHLLVAGATGSGKSVCINAMISSILFRARPDEVKFILIDPKVVELSTYNGIPHLLAPVVTDPKKAAACLKWVVNEMMRRYELFADAGVKDMKGYNRYLVERSDRGEQGTPLPYIVVVIDELADLMMVAPTDVEDCIFRLAQMARAAGIHLIVATQRPSTDVITGTIKANIPSRLAFAVSSQVDSRTILDCAGAEKLLGQGDMLFSPVWSAKPFRAQGAYISEREIDEVVKFACRQAKPQYNDAILRLEEQDTEIDRPDDELFARALRIVVEHRQASVSLIQRKLKVGYTRAARLIDAMEERGFIGGYEGSKPREVYLTLAEYDRLFSQDKAPDA